MVYLSDCFWLAFIGFGCCCFQQDLKIQEVCVEKCLLLCYLVDVIYISCLVSCLIYVRRYTKSARRYTKTAYRYTKSARTGIQNLHDGRNELLIIQPFCDILVSTSGKDVITWETCQ